ncbi:MAG: hypothetical protein O3A95_05740 [Planctomycetota bacterium]|nr:hypothetical protein [Planctomycetota bacterium]MDA1113789.1 hypothetical protein [Planctomycetota bacterium]
MPLTLFLLANLAFAPAQDQNPDSIGFPHPAYPVLGLRTHLPTDDQWGEQSSWVSLSPSWLNANGTLLEADSRAALLERVANSMTGGNSLLADWMAATAPEAVTLNYRVLVDGAEALAGREMFPMGQAVAFSDLIRNACILDFDVEIASGSGIFDPIMGQQVSGSSLAIQVLPVPGNGWTAEVAMIYSKRLEGDPIAMNYAQVAGKERLVSRIAEIGGFGWLTPQAAVVLDLPTVGAGRVTLELVADSPAPAGVIALTEQVAWLSLPQLARSSQWGAMVSTWEQERAVWTNGQGDLVFEGPDAAKAASVAMQAALAMLNPIQFDLSVQRIVGGVEGERSDMQVTILEDTPMTFAQGTIRDALVEWDVEVAQVARLADPAFADFFSGWNGDLKGRRLANGKYEVELDLSFTVVDVSSSKIIRLAAATLGETGYEGNVPSSPAHTMEVETPELREVRFHGTYQSDERGRIVLIRSANSILGEGGRLRIEIQMSQP